MDNSYFHSFNSAGSGFQISNGQVNYYQNFFDSGKKYIGSTRIDALSPDSSGIAVYGNSSASIQGGTYSISVGYSFYGNNDIEISGNTGIIKNLTVMGNLSVLGTKNAANITRNGVRLTPAYETAESYLGDIGTAVTDDNGESWIEIETLFSDVVNTTDYEYQVFLQSYSEGFVFVHERQPYCFCVKSSVPNVKFAWEVKAKRRGYETDRLVLNDMTFEEVKEIEEFKNEQ